MEVEIAVLLFGHATEYFPYVLFAFERLGEAGLGVERVPFRIERVVIGSNGEQVFSSETPGPVPLLPAEVAEASIGEPREGFLRVEFLTPMRLRVEKRKALRRPDFGALVYAALRRLELLVRVHEAGEFTVRAPEIVGMAREAELVEDETRWHDVVRYSQRQGRTMPLGGFVGSALFSGKVLGLTSVLSLAGRVHVGRGTAFGNGHFRVEEVGQ